MKFPGAGFWFRYGGFVRWGFSACLVLAVCFLTPPRMTRSPVAQDGQACAYAASTAARCSAPLKILTINGYNDNLKSGIHEWVSGQAKAQGWADTERYDPKGDVADDWGIFTDPMGDAKKIADKIKEMSAGCKCTLVVAHSWGSIVLFWALKNYGPFSTCFDYLLLDPPQPQWFFMPGQGGNNTPHMIKWAAKYNGGIYKDPNVVSWTGGDTSNPDHNPFVSSPSVNQSDALFNLLALMREKAAKCARGPVCEVIPRAIAVSEEAQPRGKRPWKPLRPIQVR